MYQTAVFLACLLSTVLASENVTTPEVPVDTLVNLTNNNELWTILLKDCQTPTLNCVQNNIFSYLKKTLNVEDDFQLTSFMKFTKNKVDFGRLQRSFDYESNDTDHYYFPLESMSRTLQGNAEKFFMTHDLEVSLPQGIIPNSVLKIGPKGYDENGALVNLEIVSKDLEEAREVQEGSRLFKKIQKFISEKLIYALIAIVLVIKLLAVKFLFVLPLIVGAATAKKLLLKVLVFVFPFLHHIFKFCAYYPIQAKYHHHKHLISHIHQVSPTHHDHHDDVHYGPPHDGHEEHYSDFEDDVHVVPEDGYGYAQGWLTTAKHFGINALRLAWVGARKLLRFLMTNPWLVQLIKGFIGRSAHWTIFVLPRIVTMALGTPWIRQLTKNTIEKSFYWFVTTFPWVLKSSATHLISHRKDPVKKTHGIRRRPDRPYSTSEVKYLMAKAEKEALIKARLETERIRIREENLRLQEQLNHAVKLQEKLKQQAHLFTKKVPPTRILASVPYGKQDSYNPSPVKDAGIDVPAGYIPQHSVPQKPAYPYQYQDHHAQSSNPAPVYKPEKSDYNIQPSIEYDPRVGVFDNSGEVQNVKFSSKYLEKPREVTSTVEPVQNLDKEIYQASEITYDKFFSPILEKIDIVLQGLGFNEEPCKERLICSMYKNPKKFSPHSNLLSAELSRDSSELQKPSTTNSVVIRFYKYVQAARDGQDQKDCLRLYPACQINTEVS